jgi:pyruvate,water dikinase
MGFVDLVKKAILRKREDDPASADELRTAFKHRYHLFKLLLNANNRALDTMVEIEEALKGAYPFGMSFVRSRCISVSTSVFQMVKNINDLAPSKYGALYDRFKETQRKINPFIRPKTESREGPLVISVREVDKSMADQVGSKMANLGEMGKQDGWGIPRGFAVTARAYSEFMKHNDLQAEIDRRIQGATVDRLDALYGLSASLQQLIIGSPLPDELGKVIMEQYRILEEETCHGVRVALRSSALGEDLPGTSFAGQYRSELNVSGENILQAYKEVVASKYGITAMTYRLNRGIRDEDVAMCVGCLEMVEAVSGGVMYSRNPLNIRDDAVVINAAWGLPKSVVDGSTACDLFVVSRGDPMTVREKEISVKDRKFVCYPDEGVCRLDTTGDERVEPCLSDDQAVGLAGIAVRMEKYYGRAQDMEWIVKRNGGIVLLQCRPLEQKGISEKGREERGSSKEPGHVLLKGGVTASTGAGAGPVYILKKDMDALTFPEGAVLVTAQSLPRWATLLGRAAAVITEQGGVAGHLANVCREFGVPAIFGLPGAMNRLDNGRMVTVDADAARVYEGRIDELLVTEEKTGNLMSGSPVYEALEKVSALIVPLNLLDPDALGFKAENCRTFHDITRFCHEKAVHEMFQFGKEHRFPERSSKQLLCEVPMQWWVLNLDDGFREEVEGKFVRLENIVSVPMLALWEGIAAKPWEGPPPMDGKGFMSVMFEATRNTALEPGMRSKYGNRNYFMISKNYCSLNSRLGFHFSMVETLVSDRASENYISFQFKGGAADFNRRYGRVIFIKDLLDEYGFRVQVREDNLLARLEDKDMESMKEHLRVLGFLTIHTRQLDMIMANPSSFQFYRSKISNDIRALLNVRK